MTGKHNKTVLITKFPALPGADLQGAPPSEVKAEIRFGSCRRRSLATARSGSGS